MLMPVRRLIVLGHGQADAAQLAVAVGVGLARLHDGAAGRHRPLGDGHEGVVGRVSGAVGDQHVAEAVDVEGHFGDERPVDVGEVGGDQRGLAGVAAEQLDHADALV